MAIIYSWIEDKHFAVGDTETGRTMVALQGSKNARAAEHMARATAVRMMNFIAKLDAKSPLEPEKYEMHRLERARDADIMTLLRASPLTMEVAGQSVRVHDATRTVTGRMVQNQPNIQQIPIHTAEGDKLRLAMLEYVWAAEGSRQQRELMAEGWRVMLVQNGVAKMVRL